MAAVRFAFGNDADDVDDVDNVDDDVVAFVIVCVPFRCFECALIVDIVDVIPPSMDAGRACDIDDTLLTKYLLTCMTVAGVVKSPDSCRSSGLIV